jgi:hypothetical protein
LLGCNLGNNLFDISFIPVIDNILFLFLLLFRLSFLLSGGSPLRLSLGGLYLYLLIAFGLLIFIVLSILLLLLLQLRMIVAWTHRRLCLVLSTLQAAVC